LYFDLWLFYVTRIFLPEEIDGGKLFKFIRDDMGVTLTGAQEILLEGY